MVVIYNIGGSVNKNNKENKGIHKQLILKKLISIKSFNCNNKKYHTLKRSIHYFALFKIHNKNIK